MFSEEIAKASYFKALVQYFYSSFQQVLEVVTQRCSIGIFKILQNLQKTPVLKSLLNNVAYLQPAILLRKDSDAGLFL